MVEIDHRYDNLKAIQKAGWCVPTNQPDLVPASEAKLLREAYRELQRSPEARTKGDKFLAYQQLEFLRGYILIGQHQPVVEQYIKQDDGGWKYMARIGLESSLTLPSVQYDLALRDVYADVVWENEEDLTA